MIDEALLVKMLSTHEGNERFPYVDTVGKVTIGVGFNLTDEGLYPEEIEFILRNRLRVFSVQALSIPGYRTLSATRKLVILDMLYNMGMPRLLGFKKMLAALVATDYTAAAKEMLDSKWARQVGRRAQRLAEMMEKDEWPKDL